MQPWLPVILLAVSLSACVSGGGSDPRIHYAQFDAEPPKGNRITVCHAYTCKYLQAADALHLLQAGHRRDRRGDVVG